MAKVQTQVAATFPPGTEVHAFRRWSDDFAVSKLGQPVGTGKVDKTGGLQIGKLEPVDLWLVADLGDKDAQRIVHVRTTAKREDGDHEPKPVTLEDRLKAQAAESPFAGRTVVPQEKTGRKGRDLDATVQPGQRQQDMHPDTPQRSSTPLGEATPVHPDEVQPSLKQSDVPDKTPQRSSTEHGEATPVDPGEVQPHPSQADAKKNLAQRSATEVGEQTPADRIPRRKRAVPIGEDEHPLALQPSDA